MQRVKWGILVCGALLAFTGCMAGVGQMPQLGRMPELTLGVQFVDYRDGEPSSGRQESSIFRDTPREESPAESGPAEAGLADFTPWVKARKAVNADTVGWVYVPDAGINDAILQNTGSNEYYLHHDFYGNETREGSFYADYRSRFGKGNRGGLSQIVTLYGHSFREDPGSGLFSGLKYFRDEQFAREHPYIYFSTWAENFAFEVVAVFESHVHIPYNRYDLPAAQYRAMLETVSASSFYNYNTAVNEDDKLLVLSTCAMSVQGHPSLDPYTTDYRFVVMGKLVPAGEATKTYADFTVNPSPAAPDTYRPWWESKLLV